MSPASRPPDLRLLTGLVLLALKAILCTIYYEHPDAQREIGVDGCASPPP